MAGMLASTLVVDASARLTAHVNEDGLVLLSIYAGGSAHVTINVSGLTAADKVAFIDRLAFILEVSRDALAGGYATRHELAPEAVAA